MNKGLFITLFTHKPLFKLIFYFVHYIHRTVLRNLKVYKWVDLSDHPHIASQYGYVEPLKIYLNSEKIKCILSSNQRFRAFSYFSSDIYSVILETCRIGNLEVLKYIIEVLGETNLLEVSKRHNIMRGVVSKTKAFAIFEYLDSLQKPVGNSVLAWNYSSAYSISPCTGNLKIVQYISSKCKSVSILDSSMHECAAENGNIDILDWLLKRHPPFVINLKIWEKAVKSGNIDLLRYMNNQKMFSSVLKMMDREYSNSSIRFSSREIIEFLVENGVQFNMSSVITDVVSRDSTEFLEWIFQLFQRSNRFEHSYESAFGWIKDIMKHHTDITEALDLALDNGSIECLKWLHSNDKSMICSQKSIENIIFHSENNVHIVKWLYDNVSERCTQRFGQEFSKINFDHQKFFITHHPDVLPDDVLELCGRNLYSDQDELFDYIVVNHLNFIKPSTLARSMRFSNIDVINLLMSKLFPFGKVLDNHLDIYCYQSAIHEAVEYSNLELVKLLSENGSITESNLNKSINPIIPAICRNNTDIITYLHNHSLWTLKDNIIYQKIICKRNHIKKMARINLILSIDNSASYNIIHNAILFDNLSMVVEMIQKGFEIDSTLFDLAVKIGKETLQYFVKNGYKGTNDDNNNDNDNVNDNNNNNNNDNDNIIETTKRIRIN